MDFGRIDRLAEEFAGKISRFEFAELKEKALRGEGPMAGLSRFDMAQVEQLYEKKREEK